MNELDGFRAEIDRIDTELARLLELRFDLCEEIGRYKRMNGLPIENCEREKELVAARTEGMLSHQSDAVAVFRMIIRRAKRIQKEKLNLYLVGMPGSGKSRTARRLARAIEKPVADTDKLIIDKQGMSIDEIFDTHGEAFFRQNDKFRDACAYLRRHCAARYRCRHYFKATLFRQNTKRAKPYSASATTLTCSALLPMLPSPLPRTIGVHITPMPLSRS